MVNIGLHAYLDPISGSVILQALIAGGLAALLSVKKVGFAIRHYATTMWRKITGKGPSTGE
jgi:hypothetical protein